METYTALRHFADSWGLVLMFLGFGAAFLWVFRPGARKAQAEAATQIFRNEDAPKPDESMAPRRGTEAPLPRAARPDSTN